MSYFPANRHASRQLAQTVANAVCAALCDFRYGRASVDRCSGNSTTLAGSTAPSNRRWAPTPCFLHQSGPRCSRLAISPASKTYISGDGTQSVSVPSMTLLPWGVFSLGNSVFGVRTLGNERHARLFKSDATSRTRRARFSDARPHSHKSAPDCRVSAVAPLTINLQSVPRLISLSALALVCPPGPARRIDRGGKTPPSRSFSQMLAFSGSPLPVDPALSKTGARSLWCAPSPYGRRAG